MNERHEHLETVAVVLVRWESMMESGGMGLLDPEQMAEQLDVLASQIATIALIVFAGHNLEYQTPERSRSVYAYGHSAVHPSVEMVGSLETRDATFPYQHLAVGGSGFHRQPGCAYLPRDG